jgi:outer membrane receptor protein involved in Fe transport
MRKYLQFLFIIFLCQTIATAQSTGKISGKITDKETGEAVPFANVFIEGTSLGSAADEEGNYTILNIAPGIYTVTASVVGYQKISVTDVRVNVDFTTRLDFQMSTGAIDLPTVIVRGDRNPLIRQDLTNPTVAITEEQLQELPVDQISDVIRLQAGVVTGNDGSLHIRGGYGNEIAYTLNGVSVNDPYGNSRAIGVATNAIQEVSVSTGTFSAQYGNALSGVVNYVTKEGSENYSFSIRSYAGDYLSDNKIYDNIDDIDPLNRARGEMTLGGPLPFIKDARFYLSGIFENFKGSLYGTRLYNPTDSYLTPDNFRSGDPRRGASTGAYYFNPFLISDSSGQPTGSSGLVPMDESRNINAQGNISYGLSPLIKLRYELVYNQGEASGGGLGTYREYKYNPDGRGKTYDYGLINTFDITHTLNDYMFYTLKASYGLNENKYYLYKNFDNPGYMPELFRKQIGNTDFYAGGTDNYRSFRKTTSLGLKGDIVAQLFNSHEFKSGFEIRKHKLELEAYSVQIGKLNEQGVFEDLNTSDLLYNNNLQLVRRIPDVPSLYNNYIKEPLQASVYVQDKIELAQTLILNVGLRYEYFDPASTFNPELSRNLVDSISGFINAYNISSEIKHTLSPRISVSYPITDKGIIRLSYGHFYQNGSLSSLYDNSQYYVSSFGVVPSFGNPNVEPQRSVQYEIGLQQQLTDDFKFDLTGFYKDVSNYIFKQTIYTSTGSRQFTLLTNLAYANTRGVTISFLKRRSPGSLFSASLDYTFSIAEGNRTEPSDELFFSEQSGKQSETYLVPLAFDRAHVINGTIGLSNPDDWGAGIVFNFQTGTPYTPGLPGSLASVRYEQNSALQTIQWNVDLKLEKFFSLGSLNYSVFVQVENLFDTRNELAVYASSGRALTNVEQTLNAVEFLDLRNRINRGDPGLFDIDQINGYYSNRPERISKPREVRLGFSVLFN